MALQEKGGINTHILSIRRAFRHRQRMLTFWNTRIPVCAEDFGPNPQDVKAAPAPEREEVPSALAPPRPQRFPSLRFRGWKKETEHSSP